MTRSWSDFTLTFMSVFLLVVITWVPFMPKKVWNLVCYLPELNLYLYARVAPRSCPRVRLGVRMYSRAG